MKALLTTFLLTVTTATGLSLCPKLTPKIRIHASSYSHSPHVLSMTATAPSSTDTNTIKPLNRDRYVATNRFAVRKGREAKFEQRWATRKSRLASLEGFRHFHLMRRVKLDLNNDNDDTNSNKLEYDGGVDSESSQGNYVSFTIWNEKKDFNAWRAGDAFKEAHGGTSIGAFISTMVNSAWVLQGPPRPAFYDGLLVQSIPPDSLPAIEDGWRCDVNADGVHTLPAECFVACNQFYVPNENTAAFEQRWATRTSTLQECDGFVAFSMLRRDGKAKGHGTVAVQDSEPSHVSTTIWKNKAAFDGWRKSQAFQKAHGGVKKEGEGGKEAPQQQPLWSQPPKPVFYEGTLVISTPQGA